MKKTNVFVYGTLLKGRSNHRFIAGCEYLGRGMIGGFEMYDLGCYPAIVPGEGSVLGEVYTVDEETVRKLDFFEGNGELYIRKTVRVIMEKDKTETRAEVYIYLRELERDRESRVWEYMQPYGSSDGEHIWYVSYGSNMCRERFMKYINGEKNALDNNRRNGCADKTQPVRDKGFAMHYERYFGKASSRWGFMGVAFLDKDRPNNTLGRAWLITRGQLHDIHRQEGWSRGWYDAVICLESGDGIPAFTLTGSRRYEDNPPAKEYLAVIEKGNSEPWGDIKE